MSRATSTRVASSSSVGGSLRDGQNAAISRMTTSGAPIHSSTSAVVRSVELFSTLAVPISTIQANDTGTMTFQPMCMNWS